MKQSFVKKYVKKLIIAVVVLVVFIFAVNPTLIPFTSPAFKESVGNVWQDLFGNVSAVTDIFHFSWSTIFQLVAMVLLVIVLRYVFLLVLSLIHPKSGTGKSLVSFLSSLVGYLAVIVAVSWGLSILGVNITAIFAGIGILALIISFGAESLIEDVLSGIFLTMDKQFNVGDIIEVDGFRGTVVDIGVRSTYVQDNGKNVRIINNSEVRKVTNLSCATSIAVCDLGISYGADLREVEKVLKTVLPAIQEAYPEVFPTVPRYLGVQTLADSAVVLRIVGDVHENDIFTAPRILNRELKLAMDDAGIEIPFPQVVVHRAED